MALKEQANKKGTPRNNNDALRDGKPLHKHITKEENRHIDGEELLRTEEETLLEDVEEQL